MDRARRPTGPRDEDGASVASFGVGSVPVENIGRRIHGCVPPARSARARARVTRRPTDARAPRQATGARAPVRRRATGARTRHARAAARTAAALRAASTVPGRTAAGSAPAGRTATAARGATASRGVTAPRAGASLSRSAVASRVPVVLRDDGRAARSERRHRHRFDDGSPSSPDAPAHPLDHYPYDRSSSVVVLRDGGRIPSTRVGAARSVGETVLHGVLDQLGVRREAELVASGLDVRAHRARLNLQ